MQVLASLALVRSDHTVELVDPLVVAGETIVAKFGHSVECTLRLAHHGPQHCVSFASFFRDPLVQHLLELHPLLLGILGIAFHLGSKLSHHHLAAPLLSENVALYRAEVVDETSCPVWRGRE